MRGNRVLFCQFVLLFIFAISVLVPQPASAASVTLSFSSHHPPEDVQSKLLAEWMKEVEKRTGGKVQFEFFPAESKISGPQTYNGVVHGFVDIGFSVMQYTRGRFPLLDFIDLPLGYPSGKVNTAIINEVFDKFKPAEFDKVKVLYLMAPGPFYLHTVGEPIRKVADWKGKKFHYLGIADEIVKAMGATPVSLPMLKLYKSLQDGVVQGGLWDYSASVDWKFAEVIDNDIICDTITHSTGLFVIMNKERWDSLDPDVQRVMESLAPIWAAKHGQAWDDASARGLAYSKKLGRNIITIDPAEAKRWREQVQPVIDAYVNNTESKGLPGTEVIKFVEKCLTDAKAGKFKSQYMN